MGHDDTYYVLAKRACAALQIYLPRKINATECINEQFISADFLASFGGYNKFLLGYHYAVLVSVRHITLPCTVYAGR